MLPSSRCLSILFIFILCIMELFCTFNVEEMKYINYDVDISVIPVKREETSQPVIHVTSKSGQEFQCVLPQLSEEEISEKEITNEKEEDVLELLKPMKSGPCLSKGKDWWTYEFCFGHYIKQFHVEDGQIIGQVITLGLYESDYDWNNETDQEKFKHVKQRYHSQYYTNGTKCDLTGQPRNTEVRIYCEEDAGDYIYRVDEPETCSYIITVHTSRLCSHPLLKPLPSNKAHSIPCHPVLNDEQYANYQQKLKEQKALAEEKRNQWLTNQQERLQEMKNINLFQVQDVPENAPTESKLFALKSVKRNAEMVRTLLVNEYDKEIEKLKKLLPPEKFETVKNDIQKEFDTILNEAKEDLDSSELDDETKDISFNKLTSVLSMLLEKLDKAEKDVAKATKELHKARSVITEIDASDIDEEPKYDDEEKKDTAEKKKTDFDEETLQRNNEQTESAVLDDDKLQVRIRRLERKSSDTSGKLHEMDFEQRKKLEQAVKEKLEKAGLDTGGRRIEVKIITAGYYDNEDGKDFQSLTDEETDQFQNMIMALLTGQQEAVQEMKRHKKLEESYQFTWDDSEEMDNKED